MFFSPKKLLETEAVIANLLNLRKVKRENL